MGKGGAIMGEAHELLLGKRLKFTVGKRLKFTVGKIFSSLLLYAKKSMK